MFRDYRKHSANMGWCEEASRVGQQVRSKWEGFCG
nr:MAG TPA: hypothetical protein [Caudoviricetes sp.]